MMKSDENNGLSGRIFDVRRFSTHDGAGIRTTVFFKGCPLRCLWCHNPEGIDFARRPVWFSGKCIRCGLCSEAAQHEGVVRNESGVVLHPEQPEDWDRVMDACPTGALRWDSRDVRVEELFAEIERDKPFFAHGGGITLSGGDPLMQHRFAAALLQRCRDAGIHTAIETELHATHQAVQAVLPLCDRIYADLKLYDAQSHMQYTGMENHTILQRLTELLSGELASRVIVRTPLIPGITATADNLTAIGRFLFQLNPQMQWELLNYNPLASAKYPLLGQCYGLPEKLPRYNAEQMVEFKTMAKRAGIQNVTIE